MRYWWVNQNQTYKHEVPGGYLWCPKAKSNGQTNPFYEFMREVAPGDPIFSFCDTGIRAIGIALSTAYEAPKPIEFGSVGAYWETIGWRVDVRFTELRNVIRPVDHIDRLAPYLPRLYSPLQANGKGLQGIYLTELGELLALQLVDLIGTEARAVLQAWSVSQPLDGIAQNGQAAWEEHQIQSIQSDTRLAETEKLSIVLARRGQGLFKARVARIERRCRVTGVENPEYLRASHTKPWRDASNEERLNGENGLLLTPDVDFLFDRGLISFQNNGKVLISPVADLPSIERMGISRDMLSNVGAFADGQKGFLEFHRASVFLEANVRRTGRRH